MTDSLLDTSSVSVVVVICPPLLAHAPRYTHTDTAYSERWKTVAMRAKERGTQIVQAAMEPAR